jgi:uncharacterized membrane protein
MMTRIQQSVEIGVPVQVAYNQLTQFEDYPQFMQDVNSVQQLDDTHLHWVTKQSNRNAEWDTEITEQEPDRCIAWHSTTGPAFSGKVELQPVGVEASRVTLTLETEVASSSGTASGNSDAEIAERLEQDLTRLKQFLENRGSETGAWRGEVHAAQSAPSTRSDASTPSALERDRSTQSDNSLSQFQDDDAEDQRFSIAEEVSFDLQSDAARRVGQAPQEDAETGGRAVEGMGEAMKQEGQPKRDGKA